MSVNGEKYIFYHYNPSIAAAVVFIVLFSITTILHTVQLARNRTWYFIPFLIGGFCESTYSIWLQFSRLICTFNQSRSLGTLVEFSPRNSLRIGPPAPTSYKVF